jgi:hypothetical protein
VNYKYWHLFYLQRNIILERLEISVTSIEWRTVFRAISNRVEFIDSILAILSKRVNFS